MLKAGALSCLLIFEVRELNILRKGYVYIYYGEGKGKTTLAIGQGIRAIGEELTVVMIQFLDYNNTKETIPLKKLEPEFRIFRFEKMRTSIDDIDDVLKKEIKGEIRNAFNFTRKIIETGECDMLILDGIIEAVEKEYIEQTELCELLEKRLSYMDVILTGQTLHTMIADKSDYIYRICTEKKPVY